LLHPHIDSHSPRAEEKEETFRPLIFGEALFDHFLDGNKVLGGAPFNVAWHLRGFKANPLIVTSVGQDASGTTIRERMADWGMDTSGLQIHSTRPTGRVTARLEGGEPHYEIEAGQAYDAISVKNLPALPTLGNIQLLYHGSLAVRERTSAEALASLRETLDVPILLDVNLRAPWWSREKLTEHLKAADWVKVNRGEAGLLARLPVHDDEELSVAASALREEHGIGTLVITLGADGAMAMSGKDVHWQRVPAVSDFVDPVGAGDAFSAVLALGIHENWPVETTLRRATEFAAELCRIRGATSENRELYSRHVGRWAHAT